MKPRHISKTLRNAVPAVALTVLLTACGGGAGPEGTSPPAVTAASAVGDLVPGATMAWATAAENALVISVTGADGRPAAGAGVRVFSLTRSSPHDSSALEQPVPVSLLDSAVGDAAGQVRLTLQLPAHLGEVLIVATLADSQAQRAVPTDGSAAEVSLTLAR